MVGCSLELDFDILDNMVTLSSTGDTVNGLPIMLSVNDESSIIDSGHGQVLIINGSNILLKDQVLNGIPIGLDIWYSNDVIIENCFFESNYYGILMMWSNSCKVTDSFFRYNEEGIEIFYSGDIEITLSTFETNYWAGMFVEHSDYLLITKNNFYNNTNYGACIQYCSNSQIYWNNFTDSGDQAFDYDGVNNNWYNNVTQEGNWWSDYDGISGNYSIPGNTGFYDLYPLSSPYVIIPEFPLQMKGLWAFLISLTLLFIIIPVFKKKMKVK